MDLKYKIEGLDCPNCAAKVERRVAKMAGVKEAVLDFSQGFLFIEYDGENHFSFEEELRKEILKVEPDVQLITMTRGMPTSHHHHNHDHCECEHEHHDHDHCDCGHEHHNHDHCDCEHEHHDHEHHHAHHPIKEEKELENAITLKIEGLDCPNCAMKVERKINELFFVKEASVHFSTSKLQVVLNEDMDSKEMVQQIQKIVDSVENGVTVSLTPSTYHEHKIGFDKKEIQRLVLGVFVLVGAILMEQNYLGLVLFIISYLIIGGKVLLKAFKNIKQREIFDENFLMVIATLGAFIVGQYSEGVAVMLFYEIGELFQGYAVRKSRKDISNLMNIRADYANVLRHQEVVKVKPEEVRKGETILLIPGERVPVDGIVLEGGSSLDMSSLTGESLPVEIKEGDEVLAGSVNLEAVIKVTVTKELQESTVTRILEMVENASSKKAQIEKFITRFARVYTPIVCLLALLLVLIPTLFIKESHLYDWLYRACIFLVVSCPCALVISIPLGLFAGIGRASQAGVLIKGGNYLELLKDIDTLVVDKTGTLTKGKFKVTEIFSNQEDLCLELGAYGENYSSHPIARSIKEAYGKSIDESRLNNYKEVAGHGIEVLLDDKILFVGNEKWMNLNKISVETTSIEATCVYVAYDHQFIGTLCIKDEIKENSKETISNLKKEGIQTVIMLTGDNERVASDVAKTLTIDHYFAKLLPHQKVEKVEEILHSNHKVAFVGDGINDAPVLARADVGIAMGGVGSDAAIEASDIVLMKDDLSSLTFALRLSKYTNKILKQNVVFSLIVKVTVLILAALGYSNMWMGVFADVGVTLLAILNSMRIMSYK